MLFKESWGGSERGSVLPSASIYRVLAERNEKLSRDVGIDLVINSSFLHAELAREKSKTAQQTGKRKVTYALACGEVGKIFYTHVQK